MAKYLYPCPQCNQAVPVATTQAGQGMVCSRCNHSFEAPQLQILRQLPAAGGATVEKVERPGVNRGLFVIGLSLLLFGSVTGYFLHGYARTLIAHSLPFDVDQASLLVNQTADKLTSAELMAAWYEMEENKELPEWVESPYIGIGTQGAILKKFAYGLWGLAGLGLLTLLASWVFKK